MTQPLSVETFVQVKKGFQPITVEPEKLASSAGDGSRGENPIHTYGVEPGKSSVAQSLCHVFATQMPLFRQG
jgi:hypothetical protein